MRVDYNELNCFAFTKGRERLKALKYYHKVAEDESR